MGTLWSQERPQGEGQPTEQSGWRDMTRRLLTTLLLVGLLLGSSVLLIYISQSCGPRHDEPPVDPHLLDTYLASRDTSVDPCTDFFSYVCGKAKGTNHSFQALAEENKSQLRRILETSQSWHLGSGEEKAFQFYNSCMDMSAIEAAGAGPLRQVIEELGGWRISGNWTSLDFNRTLRLLMSQYGYFPFFRAYLGPHPSPQHEPVIQIDQPELDAVLRQEQEQKVYAQIMREYLTYLNSLGNLLGGDSSKVQQHAYMSISITSQLLHFLRPLGQQRAQGKLSQMVTIGQLQEMAPAIDWLSCLQATFPLMSLSPTQLVVVHDLDYLQNMSRLVDKQLAEHRDFLQSHMIFGLVGRLSPALDSRFQEAHRSLHQKLRELIGQPLMPTRPRWMMCVEETESFFEPTLAAMFVPEAFSPSTQSAATELFTTIKDVLMTHLRSLPWVDEETRRKAQDRVTQLQVQLGAPEWALKPALAGREYNDIHLGPSYLQSFLSCVRSRQARAVQSSLQPFPQHRWHTSPREVRAYYSVSDHAMVFPARLFQPPFFHPRYPRAVNWGAAGSIMARELLHLFDQLLLPGGCPACDSHVLHEARLCLEHLYAAVPLPTGTSFGGSHTFQENAADVGALAIALQAYNKSLLWHRGETALPQPDLSSHQLFFFSYAKVKCMELSTRESQDTHSPPALRVHGPLDNTPDFARHFSCPRGALLKSYRCQLW